MTLTLSTEVSRPQRCARDLEAATGDPLHLGPRVLARVEPCAVLARALLTEVETADELAHDHHVDPGAARRAQVRVDPELLAQREQALLRPHRLALELRQADRGEQHGVGGSAGRERLVRERRSLGEDRVAAERVLRVRDPERVEHADRLGRDLRARSRRRGGRRRGERSHRDARCARS